MSDFLAAIQARAVQSNRFASVERTGDVLRCRAKGPEAWYVVDRQGDSWAISLLTPDRWLSESIEGDMLEGRDTAEDLIDDELVELNFPGKAQQVKHFRDDAKMYVFRSRIPVPESAAEDAATYVLAFEAAFANLGDMQSEGAA